ncbi:MAG: hypothetical protein OXO52_22260 [Rhodospirillales bacterium]|nr:hypothetical protein [Rhodospirillales bacterium]MDE0380754.1 hypothetical protein [Rhodospirillales bacterium]
MSEKDYADLAAKVAALEERMETKQAEYRSDIADLAKDIADRNAEAADRQAAAADRMASRGWWQMAITIAAIGTAAAVAISFLQASPVP